MVKMGGSASLPHLTAFQGLERLFRARGIDLDWVLYSDYDSMVDAFVSGEIDLAWNGPLGYVKIKRRLDEPCRVIAMRDVDINCITHFITQPQSEITTAEDLKNKAFAFGRRASEQGGLLPYYFLKQMGIDPRRDLSEASFFEDRPPGHRSHERDVVERVMKGNFPAGAVSQQTLEAMAGDGSLQPGQVRIFWSSPGYSHCCFTAQRATDHETYRQVQDALLSVRPTDPDGLAVLEAEGCSSFVAGMETGWETLEEAAVAEGLV